MRALTTVVGRAPAGVIRPSQPSGFDRLSYRLSFGSGMTAAAISLAGAIMFIALIVPDLPSLSAPAAERAAFYAEMSRNSVYRGLSYAAQLQMPLLLLFFGGLFAVLRHAEGGSGALSFAVFGAGIVLAVVTPLAALIEDHLMLGFAAAGVDPVIVASIDGLVPLSFALSGFPQALVLGGVAVLLLREDVIPRWIGWLAIPVAVLSLVGTGTLTRGALFPAAALATLLFRVWLLCLSAALLRGVARAG